MRVIPRKVTGHYARSLHREHEGEWEFDLAWKPIESWPAHVGWLAAIRHGHAALHHGLDLPFPALVLASARSASPLEMGEDVHTADIVLDVAQIRTVGARPRPPRHLRRHRGSAARRVPVAATRA